ncbi:MAG: diaminopimelate epimerase [Bacteroidota bacterium]
MQVQFFKYQGTGNDFVVVDNRQGIWAEGMSQANVARLCHRRFGIGADGLMLLNKGHKGDFSMQYYNSDGGESTMCGNGGRCLVAFAHKLGIGTESYLFEAVDGMHTAKVEDNGLIRLQMVQPTGKKQLGDDCLWIDTGSPHVVQFIQKGIDTWEVVRLGRSIRNSSDFSPGGTNVNFAQVESENSLAVRTYERGVEDETLSCGTGVTAAAYLHMVREGKSDERIRIQTLGGELFVEIQDLGGKNEAIYLIGPATCVYEGVIEI